MGENHPRTLVNGARTDLIDVRDRGLAYGDGLFETIALVDGEPSLWPLHMARLSRGCERLSLPLPDYDRLMSELSLLADGGSGAGKIILTRGSSCRGYPAPPGIDGNRVIQFSEAPAFPPSPDPEPIRARICDTRLSLNPKTAGIKHLNRLEQVMARMEWQDQTIAEGVMLDMEGYVVEGISSNLFLQEGDKLLTPLLDRCGVAGVMRTSVMESARSLGIVVDEERVSRDRLVDADAVFFTNALTGIRPVAAINNRLFQPELISRILIKNVWNKSFKEFN